MLNSKSIKCFTKTNLLHPLFGQISKKFSLYSTQKQSSELSSEAFVFIEKVWIFRLLLKSIFQSWWESIYNNELLNFETLFLCLDFLRFYSRIQRIEYKKTFLERELLSSCFRHPLCYEKQIRETFWSALRGSDQNSANLRLSLFCCLFVEIFFVSFWY